MANNKLEIIASLDVPNTASTISKDLKKVAALLTGDKGLKITCSIDTKGLENQLRPQIDSLSQSLRESQAQIQNIITAENLINDSIRQRTAEYEQIITQNTTIARAEEAQAQAERQATENARLLQQEYQIVTNTINGYIDALQRFNGGSTTRNNSGNADVQNQTAINNDLIGTLRNLSASLNTDRSAENITRITTALNGLTPALQNATQDSENLNRTLSNEDDANRRIAQLRNIQNQLEIFANANREAVTSTRQMNNGNSFVDEYQRLVNLANSTNLDNNGVQQLSRDLRNFKSEAKAAGLTSSQFFTNMGNQLKMLVTRWTSLYAIIGKLRTMINYVVDLDTAMTNLKRVTNETALGYENFLKNAAQSAKDTNSTLIDTVEQSAKWARAGYSAQEAADLSKVSLIYLQVADVSNDTAVSDMITALKGFDLQVEQSMDIVDKLDNLNNNYATSAAELGSALARSASTLHMTGNDIDETLALLTGGGEITQNFDSMAAALNVVALRIQGMKGKLEELGEEYEDIESLSKTQTQILNLTGINIFDENNEFRKTYDILKDIATVYDDLSSAKRASLTEILFGKQRANQGLSVIQAFQSGQIQRILEDSRNSAGTATNEMSVIADSISAGITRFKNAMQLLSSDFFDSDFLKNAVDFGTAFVEVLDKIISNFGVLSPMILSIGSVINARGTGIFSLIQNARNINSQISGLVATDIPALRQYNALIAQGVSASQASATALSGASQSAQILASNYNGAAVSSDVLTRAEQRTTVATTGLSTAFKTMLANFAITAALSLLFAGINKIISATKEEKQLQEERIQQAVQLSETYQEESETLSNLSEQYFDIISTTTDLSTAKESLLNVQDRLTEKYGDEAESIDLVNGKLSENLSLLRQQQKANAQALIDEYDNTAVYETAIEELSKTSRYSFNAKGAKSFLYEQKGTVLKEIQKLGLENIDLNNDAFVDFALTGTIEEQLDSLTKIRDCYKEIEGHDSQRLNQLTAEVNALQTQVDEYKKVVAEYENAKKIIADINASDEVKKEFDTLIDKALETYNTLQEANTNEDWFTARKASESLEELQGELKNLAGDNSSLNQQVNSLFLSFEKGAKVGISSIEGISANFDSILENVESNALDSVDKIEKALQSLAEGTHLSHDDAWEILNEIDNEKILRDIRIDNNGEYILDEKELIALKDSLIDKMVEEIEAEKALNKERQIETKHRIEQTKAELSSWDFEKKNILVPSNRDEYNKLKSTLQSLQDEYDSINSTLSKEDLLIKEINAHRGNTVDLAKQLEAVEDEVSKLEEAIDKSLKDQEKAIDSTVKQLQKEKKAIEDNLKAQEKEIENTIKQLNKEKAALEDSKEVLEEQLELLEEQQEELEKIIDNYKNLANVVADVIGEEIDSLESQKDDREEYYKNLIETSEDYYDTEIQRLKDNAEKKKEENDLEEKQLAIKEKQLELEEKLRDLEKAKNNKVRVYGSATGWTYKANQDEIEKAKKEVATAQDNLKSAQQSYDETVTSQLLDKQVEELERQKEEQTKTYELQRDTEIQDYENQIQALQDYSDSWDEAVNSITKDEEELLASQILGSDWREKIKNKDSALLSQYRADYRNYNTQLTTLVNGEIATLKNSIQAKEDEIKAISKQIDYWNDYKSTLQDDTKAITDSLDEQIDYWNDYKSQLQDDAQAMKDSLDDYLQKHKDFVNGESNAFYDSEVNLWNYKEHYMLYVDELIGKIDQLKEAQAEIGAIPNTSGSSQLVSESVENVKKTALSKILSAARSSLDIFADGGVSTKTGLAWLDGTKSNPELVLNNNDVQKLYNMIHNTPNLMSSMLKNISLEPNANPANIRNTTNSSNVTINIERIVANNPTEFANQLNDNYLNDFFGRELTKSKVYSG